MIYNSYIFWSRLMGPVAASIMLGAFYGFILLVIFIGLSTAETELRYFNL